jgi:PPK2 family polyphosphate:nucleotide phosphotransferase
VRSGNLAVNLRPYRVESSRRFSLRDHEPSFVPRGTTRESAEQVLASHIEQLRALQDKLYAEHRWSLLLILQGMDAAGKDSTIKHVMFGVNPQSCEVHSFKSPSDEELDHDYLWRTSVRLPRRGHIGIFNRSYYEEVLVVRVHDELLVTERLADRLVTKKIWRERFEDMVAYERHLARNGTVIVKVFLHISKDEQRQRLLQRINDSRKNWKLSAQDIAERKLWKHYMRAYEDAIRRTSTDVAPWYVVPADHKWWARTVVGGILVDTLDRLDLRYPKVTGAKRRELREIATVLEKDGSSDR